jgi:large subunit ribosomal protein L24
MARIRKGDMVEVLSGNDRGKRGRVLRTLPSKNRLVVQGVNLRWKHLRKSQQNPQGGRVRREMPIHQSNVMVFDEASGTRIRVGYSRVDGRKMRVDRKTGVEIGGALSGPAAGVAKAAAKDKKAKE